MKIKTITALGLLTLITIGFSACGNDSAFENNEQYIPVVECNTTVGVTPTQYTPMLSKDILAKLVTPTVVNTYLDANANKTVCTEIGSANLIRQ